MSANNMSERVFDPLDVAPVDEPTVVLRASDPQISHLVAEAAPAAPANVPTKGDDVLRGSGRGDSINGLAGDDEISGLNGDDTLDGGQGDDTLYGGGGDDTLVDLKGVGLFYGGDGNDTIKSGNSKDTIYGEDGADNIDGGAGNDFIDGGAGADLLNGGAGSDTIVGGGGADILTGGAGRDRFVINGEGLVLASIADFEVGKDRIEISGIEGVEKFSDLKIEFGGCGLMIYGPDENMSIALLNYFGSLDKGDFLFS